MQVIQTILAHKAMILGVLFGLSEALAYIPSVKANGVFQFVANLLKKEHDTVEQAQAAAPQA